MPPKGGWSYLRWKRFYSEVLVALRPLYPCSTSPALKLLCLLFRICHSFSRFAPKYKTKPPFETPDVKQTYKRIKVNSYCFPESVPIPSSAKNLITQILNLDPLKRPKLDDILRHPFMNPTGTIPKFINSGPFNGPPNSQYLRQFQDLSPSNKQNYNATTAQQVLAQFKLQYEPNFASTVQQSLEFQSTNTPLNDLKGNWGSQTTQNLGKQLEAGKMSPNQHQFTKTQSLIKGTSLS